MKTKTKKLRKEKKGSRELEHALSVDVVESRKCNNKKRKEEEEGALFVNKRMFH